MTLIKLRLTMLDYNIRPAKPTAIRRHIDALVRVGHAQRHELTNKSSPPERFEIAHKSLVFPDNTDDVTIDKHEIQIRIGNLQAANRMNILNAEVVGEPNELLLLAVGRDVRHKRQILDETARFAFGRVTGT